MQLITIDGIAYNLDHLVTFSYQQNAKEVMRKGTGWDKGFTFPTDNVDFTSVLKIKFIDCGEITFRDEAANVAWKTILEVLKPSPIAELETRIPPPGQN
jgi:hypothetical protein